MHRGNLHRIIDSFMGVAASLGVPCSCSDGEAMAVMVSRIMSYQSREFHTLDHIFGFLDDADAHMTLAAIFHDIVYYQVDDGFTKELAEIAHAFVDEVPGGVRLKTNVGSQAPLARTCLGIFGHHPGKELTPTTGLNEFLSALVFMHLFQHHLPPADIIAVLVCIEASIPFRKPDAHRVDPFEALHHRTITALAACEPPIPADQAAAMVHRAIRFANKDVEDFSLDDPARFLDGTWKLLPELNAALRKSGCYTLGEYRSALHKMYKFFGFLDPAWVFHSFQGVPDTAAMRHLSLQAAKNIFVARDYLMAKILAISLLEALAALSGGDAPVALFMGDLPRHGEDFEQLSDWLDWSLPPRVPSLPDMNDRQSILFRLLKHGRMAEASFDLKNSPLALYIFERTTLQEAENHTISAVEFFSGHLAPLDYLRLWPRDLMASLVLACEHMVPTRREAFAVLRQDLGIGPSPLPLIPKGG